MRNEQEPLPCKRNPLLNPLCCKPHMTFVFYLCIYIYILCYVCFYVCISINIVIDIVTLLVLILLLLLLLLLVLVLFFLGGRVAQTKSWSYHASSCTVILAAWESGERQENRLGHCKRPGSNRIEFQWLRVVSLAKKKRK